MENEARKLSNIPSHRISLGNTSFSFSFFVTPPNYLLNLRAIAIRGIVLVMELLYRLGGLKLKYLKP